jgi:hypothetical protein
VRNVANYALFQGFWLAAVWGAADGHVWAGPAALVGLVAIHLRLVPRGEREAELRYLLVVGVLGTLLDTGLHAIGATAYPTSTAAWPYLVVPPWIVALWIGFATMPRFSLGWLAGRPWLAALLGAVGGPLTFLGGTRFDAVAVGDGALLTYGALTLEYALVTPLLLALAPASNPRRHDVPEPAPPGEGAARSATS